MMSECVCLFVCTWYSLWRPNVPTSIVIPVISDLAGTFFFSAYKSYRMTFFENLKMQKVWGKG